MASPARHGRLMLLTGARPGEVAGISRSELENLEDQGRARWVLPATRSKNGRMHLIPLSQPAREIILTAIELAGNNQPYLFPSPAVKNAPITAHALAVAMARFAGRADPETAISWRTEPPTPHDLRRTLATRLAELGIAKEYRDAILNHTPRGDVGKKHYDLYDLESEKRRALARLAEALIFIIERKERASTVIKLHPRTEVSAQLASYRVIIAAVREVATSLCISKSEAGRLRIKAVEGEIISLADAAGTVKLTSEDIAAAD